MEKLGRSQHRFPSRQYPFGVTGELHTAEETWADLAPARTYRFICGRDDRPVPLASDDIAQQLHDVFAQSVLAGPDPLPITARALLSHPGLAALPAQAQFVVADGGQIPWEPENDALNREIRFAITRSRQLRGLPDFMISTSSLFDDQETFLQVIGWDPEAGAYQFYDRRGGCWYWVGSSWDALEPHSRGRGPFDSHVNGALNMKELKLPWANWHSQSAGIKNEILAPTDPLRNDPLWIGKSGAEQFQNTVAEPGIIRWHKARFKKRTAGNRLTQLQEFFRQVLETSTVNLTSSEREYKTLDGGGTVNLPRTFFVNFDLFLNILDFDLQTDLIEISAEHYRECLREFEVSVSDSTSKFQFPGDTHFMFVVPEPAFEDLDIVRELIDLGVLSKRLTAALLMVDFMNPVFSKKRAALLRHVPDSAELRNPKAFEDSFVANVQQTKTGPPEEEFLTYWNLDAASWEQTCTTAVDAFVKTIRQRLMTADGVRDSFILAESRRREFRKRKLAEFRLTTPLTNIPEYAPYLEFAPDGTVHEKI